MDRTACIVVNWNRAEDTVKCVKSLLSDPSDKDIIVVDNGSIGQNELGETLSGFSNTCFLPQKVNLGFAGGNNAGIEYALKQNTYSYIFLINNDAWIGKDSLTRMLKYMYENAHISILSPKILFADGLRVWSAGGEYNFLRLTGSNIGYLKPDSPKYNYKLRLRFASACSFLARAAVFNKQLFDEDFFMYYEDVDFCINALKNGFIIEYFPQAKVYHKGSASAGGSYGEFVSFYRYRNRLILLKKHGGPFHRVYFAIYFPFLLFRDIIIYTLNLRFKALGRLFAGINDFLFVYLPAKKELK